MKKHKAIWRSSAWVLAVVLAGCSQEAAPPASPPQVSVLTLAPADVSLYEDLPARVAALRRAEIRPQISGIVQRQLFEQGTEVQAGDALFQINPQPFQAEVDIAAAALQRAEAALLRARVHARRLQPLVQAEAVSQQTYDDAVSQREQAAAEVAQARATLARRQLDLRFAVVDAPISGRIDQALVTEGALVSAQDAAPMARIQQIDQVYVDVRQPAGTLAGMRERLDAPDRPAGGLQAEILAANGSPMGLYGRLLFSGVNVDEGTGDVLLRILVRNPRRQLLPGMYVQARVPRGHYPQALMVPQQAVRRVAGQAQAWVIDAQERAQLRALQLGELHERHYRVRGGLQAGERVVIEGGERLAPGAVVQPRAWHPPQALAPAF